MEISNKGLSLIEEFEGFKDKAYLCPAGYLTIGYGHVIREEEKELKEKTISKEAAKELLKKDVDYFVEYLNKICRQYAIGLASEGVSGLEKEEVELNQNQFDALCSFTFNTGCFKAEMIERFKARKIKEIGESLILYNKVKGKVSAGLTRRREAEQLLFFK